MAGSSLSGDDAIISDDSLTFSPTKPSSRRARAGGRQGSVKRERRQPTGGKRLAMSVPNAARGQARLPPPALGAPPRDDEHQLCAAEDGSVEARLKALERQQKADHLYFVKIRETLGTLHDHSVHSTQKSEAFRNDLDGNSQVGIQIRRELYAATSRWTRTRWSATSCGRPWTPS